MSTPQITDHHLGVLGGKPFNNFASYLPTDEQRAIQQIYAVGLPVS